MEIAVLYEKLAQEANEGWQVSDSAVQRFRESLPNILPLVNEKFRLESSQNDAVLQNLDFLMDAHRHFGETLLAIYQFHLWHNLIDEAGWYAQSVKSRGLDEHYFSKMLKTWMIAIHSYVKPPEVKELVQPIAWLSRYSKSIFDIDKEVKDLSDIASQLLHLLINNERDEAVKLVRSFFNKQKSDEAVISQLFIPVLSEIGRLWQENKISVADEHLAVANLRSIYRAFFKSKSPEAREQKIAICCVPGEEHEIGAELLALYLESRGWPVNFVGHSAPEAEILRMLDQNMPFAVILSITLISHLPALVSLAQEIKVRYPQLKILAGGGVLRKLNKLETFFNVCDSQIPLNPPLLKGENREALLKGENREALLKGEKREALLKEENREALLKGENREGLLKEENREGLLKGEKREDLLKRELGLGVDAVPGSFEECHRILENMVKNA